MGSQIVRHDWATEQLSTHPHCLPTQTNIQAKRDSLWLWRTAQVLATPNTNTQIPQVTFTYLCHPPPFFFRFKFTGAAHRNNYSVVQAPENFPWHNQLIHLNMTVDSLEEEMATHSSIVAWRIPWTEEPGGLQSVGLQTAGHDWETEHKRHAWWLE